MERFTPVGDVGEVVKRRSFGIVTPIDRPKLVEILNEWARTNRDGIESTFNAMRADNPFADVFMVREDGQFKVGAWETIFDYARNDIPPDLNALADLVARKDRLYYVATSLNSTFIFYLQQNEDALQSIQQFKSHPYRDLGGVLKIMRATIPTIEGANKNALNKNALREAGLVRAEFGYWPQSVRNKAQSFGFTSDAEPEEKFGGVISYIPQLFLNIQREKRILLQLPLFSILRCQQGRQNL